METTPALVPKAEANYRKDSGGENPCSSCANFIAPDACSAVEGTISENGTSDLYMPKVDEESNAGQSDPEALMAQLFGGAANG